MKDITSYMFQLIRNEVCGETVVFSDFVSLQPEDCEALYRLSKSQDLAHLVGHSLLKNKIVPQDSAIALQFKKQYLLAISRYKNMDTALQRIQSLLTEKKIPFIPLKGAVLREYYPEPWMRTGCDIDVLVHEEDLEKATQHLVNTMHGKCEGKGSHDIQIHFSNYVNLELHYTLIENNLVHHAATVLQDVWNTCDFDGNPYCLTMHDEMFYFYHIAHMAKHMQNGGCGIRPFLDLWILDTKLQYDKEKRDELLRQGGLLTFADMARKVSKAWFSNGQADETTVAVQNYILYGGIYGNPNSRISLQTAKKGGRVPYALSRIFLPYEIIKYHYPILQKHKWLLPFCEVRRWFKLIFCGGLNRSMDELRITKHVTDETMRDTAELLSKIGL